MWDAGLDAVGGWSGDALGGAADWATSRGFGGASGIFDALFSVEASIADVIGGITSRFGGGGGALFEDYLNFKMWEGISGKSSHKYNQNWQKAAGTETNPHLAAAGDAIKSHALISEQLQKHFPNAEVTKKYSELGLKLPDAGLLKQVKGALSSKLHPDRLLGGEELMARINASLDLLEDSSKTTAYRELLEQTEKNSELKQRLEGLLKNIAGTQSEFYEKSQTAARLALPFQGKTKAEMGTTEKISKTIYDNFAKRGNFGKATIIFGAVTGIALATYGTAKLLDKRSKNLHKKSNSFTDMIKTEKKQTQEIAML